MSETILIVGAGPGIGLATANRFAREGYRVVLASRDAARLKSHASVLKADGYAVATERVDATDAHAIARLVQGIGSELKVLHYNAGVLHYNAQGTLQTRPIETESVDSIVSDTQANLVGAMVAIQSALPTLEKRPGASILLTGGGFGVHPTGDFLTLSVGKAGIRAAALALFEPLRKRGVHVATVTVSRLVSANSREATDIADAFWELHSQPADRWTVEKVYS
jgi:short-subunit dehydrogenase